MLNRKHYNAISAIVGETLAAAYLEGGEETRTVIYDTLYRPLIDVFNRDNPDFKTGLFAYAVGRAEGKYLANAQ